MGRCAQDEMQIYQAAMELKLLKIKHRFFGVKGCRDI